MFYLNYHKFSIKSYVLDVYSNRLTEMLVGRTKHILYIKIQASSDNNRISFFKKEEEKIKHRCDSNTHPQHDFMEKY